MLEVAMLGPLEVVLDGRPVEVPRGKASELLVRLALEAGEPVSAERLVEDVWAGALGEVRRNTLQSKVAMLRRVLGHEAVANRDGAYALAVGATDVDALAVLRLAASADRFRESGAPDAAADLCASALRLFRGVPLQAAGDAEWADVIRTRVDEARTVLLEVGFWARVQLGESGSVVGELESAVASYPYQESLWELLITALYRSGRQADALSAYQRVRTHLADELGLDPGPALQQLERDILAQKVADRARAGPPTATDRRRGNLPSMSATLVGREADVAALVDRVDRERLVEIIGPGGVGKTAIALAVGRRLAGSAVVGDGVWLARLEHAHTPSEVVDVLVAALHGPGGEAALFERLRGSSGLVILDNCEHVLEAASDLAVRLLDHAPDLRVLCTSQIPLEIDGEHVVELAPLALSEAVQLFRERAVASRVTGLARDHDSVLDLCRSLDGLPLAIELAAARTRTLTVQEITRRLDDRLSILSDPASRRSERRRSLRSTIRWSYELLFPDDQRGLWALATFAGGAPLSAVESVLAALGVPAAAAIDVVDRLASRSLVTLDDAWGDTAGGVRYRLLDSIRAFALEAMDEAGFTETALAAHAGWYADAAASSTGGVRGAQQAEHLRFARTERANIDAALAWSVLHDPGRALDIASGFGWAWVVLGDSRGAERIHAALGQAGVGAPRDRTAALLLAGWIEASTGHLQLARRDVDAAASLAEASDDLDLRARCAYYLAYVVSHHGEFREALDLTDRSRELYDQLDRPWDQAANALFAARAAISAGDADRSVTAVAQAEEWLRLVEDPWLRVRGEAAQGELARVQHRFADAVTHLASAAQTSQRLGFLQTEAYQLSSLGRAQCQTGDYDAGVATLRISVEKAEATGDVRLAALVRVHLGRALRAEGRLAGARSALESAVAWHREAGGGEQAALGECLLAALDAVQRVPGAEERLVAVLAAARDQDAEHVQVFALDALARLAMEAGNDGQARDLLQEADLRMEAASHFITERDRTDAHWVRRPGPTGLGAR